ncbi:MAG: competence/damage-inducible protein A [Leeuwenhoekiella sp.]
MTIGTVRAQILTIGDEILIGQVVDTNSAFIAKALDKIGIEIKQALSIGDDRDAILETLAVAKKNFDLVIITGGLGPTKDDITKHTFCEFLGDHLVENPEVLENVERLFRDHVKRPMLPANKTQALVPSHATVLMNHYGTAPGMWMEKDQVVFISLPGVPFEMKELLESQVLPRIQKRFKRPFILHKTLQTYGVGESEIADKLEVWENNLDPSIKLAYLPSLGKVRLRLSTKGDNRATLEARLTLEIDKVKAIIGDIIVGYDDDEPLEAVLANLLAKKQKTLALAESCTGGQIAATLTTIPGASRYFKGAAVTYFTQSKTDVLNIDPRIIEENSVVSGPVAEAMAQKVKDLYKSDYALATTGNAGPSKGDADAEVGTVFIGLATPTEVLSFKFMMGNHRERVIQKTVNKGLDLLLKELSKN